MRLLEEGIPGVPKVISPRTHRILDYLTIGAFMTVGGLFVGRSRSRTRRAGIAALANGALVLGATLLTDYNGDGSKPISFETHGILDMVQAGFAAAAPHIFGFSEEAKSWFFRGQAMNEGMVIAMTDWEAGRRPMERIRDIAA